MKNDELDDARFCVRRNGSWEIWRAPDATLSAFARDPHAHTNSLADALVETAGIYNQNERLVWLKDGGLVPVNGAVVREIITQNIAVIRLVNHGTPDNPNWAPEYVPYTPSNQNLRGLLGTDRREGSLIARAPKV